MKIVTKRLTISKKNEEKKSEKAINKNIINSKQRESLFIY